MWATDYFQVIHGDLETIGELIVTGACAYGSWQDDQGDNINAMPASGNALGFVTQQVTVAGPTFEQMELGFQNLPAKSGTQVTLARMNPGAQIEVEDKVGVAYNASTGQGLMVTSGTGTLAGVAKDVPVSFKNGRLYVAQTGDTVWFVVLNPAVIPVVDTVNNLRIRFRRVQGYIK